MYPETKAPEEYEALGFTMEEELARVFAANGLDTPEGQVATPIYVQSFSPESLKRLYSIAGDTYRLIQLVGGGQEALLSEQGSPTSRAMPRAWGRRFRCSWRTRHGATRPATTASRCIPTP